ncbi:hypothetical protein [Raineyella fluvialis]|uniref:Uncharacterized protein n=1 Tax=Raineyella fluvialis TaxID=2662261 RepID=A0A5Q2F8K6_9ACTN|nr:hypothetical protein [Raineyella fluvialis]QGF23159.1 hypothetical protein Rai3103_05220 [Raineyella fluvialis]
MIEFTWTDTVAEAHLWARELRPFAEIATTMGELAARRSTLHPRPLPAGVFPSGTTDLDLLDQLLVARRPETLVADVTLEPAREIEARCARLVFDDPGRVAEWDRDQPIVALAAPIIRDDEVLETVVFNADCLDIQQHEWDELREGWLPRLADSGWQPCSTAFLTAAMTGFLDVYQRQSAPRMHDLVLVEPLCPHPVVRAALDSLRPVRQ